MRLVGYTTTDGGTVCADHPEPPHSSGAIHDIDYFGCQQVCDICDREIDHSIDEGW